MGGISMKEMWLARNYNGILSLFIGSKPEKCTFLWINTEPAYVYQLDNKDIFPEVQWSDKEPTKVKLVIEK